MGPRVHLVNPSDISFGVAVITPRWLYVLAAATGRRSLQIAGGLLVAHGLVCLAWPFASMHRREVLAAGGATAVDDWHVVIAMVTVALMFGVMASGAVAFRWWFRLYSFATIVVLLAFGALTSAAGSRVRNDLRTPWVGLWERINITVFLVWVVVFAICLLRGGVDDGPGPSRGPASVAAEA